MSALPTQLQSKATAAFKDSYNLISQYETKLPDKKLLQTKLQEFLKLALP